MSPALPVEIISHIVNLLEDNDSRKATLAHLTFVSRAILDPARVALYRKIEITSGNPDEDDTNEDGAVRKSGGYFWVPDEDDEDDEDEGNDEGEKGEEGDREDDDGDLSSGTWKATNRTTVALIKTIKAQQHLADLVQSVTFGQHEYESALGEVPALKEVLKACRNVEGIDLHLSNGNFDPMPLGHLKKVVASLKPSLKAISFDADSEDDVKLLKSLPHLLRLGIGMPFEVDPNSFYEHISYDSPTPPIFALEALRLECFAESFVSAFNFLTTSSTTSLHLLEIRCSGDSVLDAFSLARFVNLTHVRIVGNDGSSANILIECINLVAPLSNLKAFVFDSPEQESESILLKATNQLRQLPSSLQSLSLSLFAISLPELTKLLEDSTFLPSLRELTPVDCDPWTPLNDKTLKGLTALGEACEKRNIKLHQTPWNFEVV